LADPSWRTADLSRRPVSISGGAQRQFTRQIAWGRLRRFSLKPENRTETARPVPMPVQTAGNRAEAEIVSFLAIFQERGRLIDFLMDDITTYDDAQVGAAARVVHQGCKAALEEHFSVRPIREESEGSSVTIPAEYAADEYRLIGKISGPGAFSGTLLHHGWKTDSVSLPRLVRADPHRLPTIAPAEVELK